MATIDKQKAGVFFAALIVAIGGLIYELLIGTATSYLLGDSVTQFSITIGVMLFAMGIGAYIAPKLPYSAEDQFIGVELLLALIGGNSIAILYFFYSFFEAFYVLFLLLVVIIGVLIGLEVPIMLKLVETKKNMIAVTSKILSLDYFGALIASVIYPLVLLPQLGVLQTAYLVGLLNVVVATIMIWLFYPRLQLRKWLIICGTLVLVVIGSGFFLHARIAAAFNKKLYQDEVVLSQQTAYQQIVITRFKDDIRLFLNGNIQFSSIDEYRYHEPLVHIPLISQPRAKKVLILGGGDGLVAREVLKHPQIETINLVDLDGQMIDLAKSHPLLTQINQHSLSDHKVTITITDAFSYLEKNQQKYDVIIIDLPDPSNESLAKLYSLQFYQLTAKHLNAQGIVITQATSPYFANQAFWLIHDTMAAAQLTTLPLRSDVPSFGEWGFVIGTHSQTSIDDIVDLNAAETTQLQNVDLRYLRPELWQTHFIFDPDTASPSADLKYETSTLFNPTILEAYQQEAKRWQE